MQVNDKVTATVMSVNREESTACLNVGELVPAVLALKMMVGSEAEQQRAFRKLQENSQIEVAIVSIPDESDTKGVIVVRHYDKEDEARKATLEKLSIGTIVRDSITETQNNGVTISVSGVRIYIPVYELNGRRTKLNSLRPGERLTVQITDRKEDPRRGLLLFGSQRRASEEARRQKQQIEASRTQKRQAAIANLQEATQKHVPFKRPAKAVTEFGVFFHLMHGVDGLLGPAQMDKATRRLFEDKKLTVGALLTFEIESMRQKGEDWRLRLNQKLVLVRQRHEQIGSEALAGDGIVRKLLGPATQAGKGTAEGEVSPTPKQEVVIEVDHVFGVLNHSGINAELWNQHIAKLGAQVKVYSAGIDTQRGQLILKAATL